VVYLLDRIVSESTHVKTVEDWLVVLKEYNVRLFLHPLEHDLSAVS
jgi:hypothetical protein